MYCQADTSQPPEHLHPPISREAFSPGGKVARTWRAN